MSEMFSDANVRRAGTSTLASTTTNTDEKVISKKKLRSIKWHQDLRKAAQDCEIPRPQDDQKNAVFFRHSRQINLKLPTKLPTTTTEDFGFENLLSPDFFASTIDSLSIESQKIVWVDSTEDVQNMCKDLSQEIEVAVDLEGHTEFSFQGMTALIQITTYKNITYLIDPWPLHSAIVEQVRPIFEDQGKIKIFCGGANDAIWLKRDFGIKLASCIDVQIAYNRIRKDELKNAVGLNTLAKMYLRVDLDKTLRNLDWRKRPLPANMMKYAADDSFFLLKIWTKLKDRLLDKKGETEFYSILSTCDKDVFKKNCKLRDYDTPDVELNKLNLCVDDRPLFRLLHFWRNRFAAIVDNQPKHIMSIKVLIALVNKTNKLSLDDIKELTKANPLPDEQIRTIYRIANEKESFIDSVNKAVCHNCFIAGHIAGHCPYESNSQRKKEYAKVHPEYKTMQNARRRRKWKENKKAQALEKE